MDSPTFDLTAGAVVRIPTRAEVRSAVERHQDAIARAQERGENISHVALDQTDRVRLYAAALEQTHGPDAATLFLQTWADEMQAVAAHLTAQAEHALHAVDAEAHATRASSDGVAAFVAVVVVGLALAVFLLRT